MRILTSKGNTLKAARPHDASGSRHRGEPSRCRRRPLWRIPGGQITFVAPTSRAARRGGGPPTTDTSRPTLPMCWQTQRCQERGQLEVRNDSGRGNHPAAPLRQPPSPMACKSPHGRPTRGECAAGGECRTTGGRQPWHPEPRNGLSAHRRGGGRGGGRGATCPHQQRASGCHLHLRCMNRRNAAPPPQGSWEPCDTPTRSVMLGLPIVASQRRGAPGMNSGSMRAVAAR